ncbi:MAG TPA: hypothetical protein VIK27_09540 [Candidatus Aquilonibacter sp.]
MNVAMNASAVVLSLAAALLPVAASAQSLADNQGQRQAILNVEYQLNQPGVPAASVPGLQQRVAALESQVNGAAFPTVAVPVYGSCDADRSVIAYLHDELTNTDIDYQQQQTDRTAIHDLQANLHQRNC